MHVRQMMKASGKEGVVVEEGIPEERLKEAGAPWPPEHRQLCDTEPVKEMLRVRRT